MTDSIFNNEGNIQNISLDFESLRAHGIELIQKMAGEVWTDFNLHDPGVTILEQLCFALTDLAYQTNFDIVDHLSDKNGDIDYPANSFFPKQDILTSNPVTVTDYRKAIIDDVKEINNVWLDPLISDNNSRMLRGLYKITVQVDETSAKILSDIESDDTTKKELQLKTKEELRHKIKKKVRASFCSRRNLCEDIFGDIILLQPLKITVHADIEIESNLVPEKIMAQIYIALEKAVNKRGRYLTEREMAQTGLSMDQIYCGPLLKNGFLPDSELGERQQVIDAANIIQAVSGVEGVVLVKNLYLSKSGSDQLKKVLILGESEFAFIDIDKDADPQNINLFIDKYRVPPVRRGLFIELLQKGLETEYRDFTRSLHVPDSKIKGTYRDTTGYYSIQNYFPLVYGIGHEGLLKSASEERKANARQLKAYIMLFEQILTNCLAQLDHVVSFFSNKITEEDTQTYFANPLYSVPGGEDIIKAYTDTWPLSKEGWEDFKNDKKNPYLQALNTAIESDTVYNDRKNRILDHLLARFNKISVAYPARLYNSLYGTNVVTGRITREISWKASVLADLDKISYNRIRGLDYLNPHDDQYNFEEKMHKFLYIINDEKEQLMAGSGPSKLNLDSPTELPKDRDNTQSDPDENETDWKPELQKIILTKHEINDLIERYLISGAESQHRDSFVFMNQDISIFKYAININNFRIGPDPYQDSDHLLLYKAPADKRWNIIGRFTSKKKPLVSILKKLVNHLIKISTQSEGFHLVEHILLRPPADSKSYGFKFYKSSHQLIFESSELFTLTGREEIISRLLNFDPGEGFYLARQSMKLASAIKNLYLTASSIDEVVDNTNALLKQATYLLDTANTLVDVAAKGTDTQEEMDPEEEETIKEEEDKRIIGTNKIKAEKNKSIAEANKIVAGRNKGIADKSMRINVKLIERIEKINATEPDAILSQKTDIMLRAELNRALKICSEELKELFEEAEAQEARAREQSNTVNAFLSDQLLLLGNKTWHTHDVYDDLVELINCIRSYGQESYPKLKMLVTGGDSRVISEDFFSFNMTVVFPDWPARFQDINFRACAEGMFHLNAPAHINTHIKWLDMDQMKVFEPLYISWKKSLAKGENNKVAWDIIGFLNDRTNNSTINSNYSK
jgi:hypothetical protein